MSTSHGLLCKSSINEVDVAASPTIVTSARISNAARTTKQDERMIVRQNDSKVHYGFSRLL